MTDKHVRRTAADYAYAFAALLPTGAAWPRSISSTLGKVVTGLASIWELVDRRAADLLERESDPRTTIELIDDWEASWGLPDKCLAEPLTIEARQDALVTKMTFIGHQDRQFFIDMAASIGYTITFVQEFSPWMFGISQVGLTADETGYWRWEIGSPDIRFWWKVKVGAVRLSWWRFGQAQFGIDPHLRIGLATDLECLFRRYRPAHTEVLFDYSGL
jgi:uncharacterized protein YmfQ (DUF2313 family)